MAIHSRICVVIGTRAQFIKTAPVMQALQRRNIPYHFLLTGQHNDTFSEMLSDFDLKEPDSMVVDWQREAKSVGGLATWGVRAFRKWFNARDYIPFQDGLVLVHGDTPSAVWGAIAGRITNNRVFHIEAGLRSRNIFQPFPEELIRLLMPRLVDIYAAPGNWAMDNLTKHRGDKINTVHNTAVDALKYVLDHRQADASLLNQQLPDAFVVASFHRVENLYNKARLTQIVDTIVEVSKQHTVLFLMHPVTRTRLEKHDLIQYLEAQGDRIILQGRLPYAQFIPFLKQAQFIVTDSGSMQEEVVWLGVPMLVFRNASERQEGLDRNVVLSHYQPDLIENFLQNPDAYRYPPQLPDESPSEMIVDWIENYLSEMK